MLVFLIRALHIGNRILTAKTRQRIDMTVGIVSRQITAFQPQDTVQSEHLLEIIFQFFLLEIFVSVHGR